MPDPLESLSFALTNHPQRVEAVELRRLVTDSARQNPKRPAYVTLSVPDDVVKSVRSRGDEGDLVLLVRIPKDVLDRRGSRIVLPGDVR